MLKIYMLGLLMLFISGQAMTKEILLASMDYPPFYGEKLDNYGPLIELIAKSYYTMGYDVKIRFLPWARAIAWSKSGKVDGMVGVWYSPERAEYFLYSEAIISNSIGFYKRKNEDIRYKDYADLKEQGYKLGSVRGYIQPKGLQESGIPIMFVNEDLQSFKILSKNRVDLIVVDKEYSRYILAQPEFQKYAKNIEWMEPVLEEKQQHLIISKKAKNSKNKLEDFNKGLQILRETGIFTKILKKHAFMK